MKIKEMIKKTSIIALTAIITIGSITPATAKAAVLTYEKIGKYVADGPDTSKKAAKKYFAEKNKIAKLMTEAFTSNLEKGAKYKNDYEYLSKNLKNTDTKVLKNVNDALKGFGYSGIRNEYKKKYDNEAIKFFNKSHGKPLDVMTDNNKYIRENIYKNVVVYSRLARAKDLTEKMNKKQRMNYSKDLLNYVAQYTGLVHAGKEISILYTANVKFGTDLMLYSSLYYLMDTSFGHETGRAILDMFRDDLYPIYKKMYDTRYVVDNLYLYEVSEKNKNIIKYNPNKTIEYMFDIVNETVK